MKKALTEAGIKALKPADTRYDIIDAYQSGLTLRVGKRAKIWTVTYMMGGRRRRMELGTWPDLGVKAARERAEEARSMAANGIDPRVKVAQAEGGTFAKAVERFFAEADKPGVRVSRRGTPKSGTLTTWRGWLEAWALPKLGDMELSKIGPPHVRAVLEACSSTSAPSRRDGVLKAIRGIFTFAELHGLIEPGENPAMHVRSVFQSKPRTRVLTDAEIKALWHGLEADGHTVPATYVDAVKVLLLTGQRKSEVSGMRWDEVDLDAGVWTLPASRNKSARTHTIPLSDAVLSVLERCRETATGSCVFPQARDQNKVTCPSQSGPG